MRLALITLVLLSGADAAMTLATIHFGGEEVNPVMALAMVAGTIGFIAVKMTLTTLGAAVLYTARAFRSARVGTAVLLGAYIVLMVWHCHLSMAW